MRARPALLILALACAGGCATPKPPPHSATQAPAAKLPPIALATLDGKPQPLATLLAGRPALISLWATWCDACAAELPALDRLRARAGSLGAVVVAVSEGEPRDKVAAFARWRGLSGIQLVDEQFRLADALGQRRVPTTLVIDRQGRVTFTGGALDGAALAALRAALDPRMARR